MNVRSKPVDWAKTRIGEPWSLCSHDHIEGNVIRAKDYAFTSDGLRVQIALRDPWFELKLKERLIDARRFDRLQFKVNASAPGVIQINAGMPRRGVAHARIKAPSGSALLTADLKSLEWKTDANKRTRWGGPDALISGLGMTLKFPQGENVIVKIRDVSLLGRGAADHMPPRIDPLPDLDGAVRFRIADSSGVLSDSLMLSVNGLVFDLQSRALSWDGSILSWKAPHVGDEHLTIYVEAADREGNRGSLEIRRRHPRTLDGTPMDAPVGFPTQHRRHEARVTKGRALAYRVPVSGRHAPINRTVEFHGAVRDPKVMVDGGIDFDSPRTIVRSLIAKGMTDREKAFAIWRFEMRTASSLGLANPIDRTKYVNVFGYGYCTSHAQTVQALCEESGLPWMFLKYNYPGGHGTTQFYYDRGWRMLDSHQRLYLLKSDTGEIASAEQIEGDPDILCPSGRDLQHYRIDQRYPQVYYRPTEINPIHYTKIYKSILGGSMAQTLRRDERLIRTWQGHGRWAHSPSEPLDYANGWLVFRPTATRAGLAAEAESVQNIGCPGDGHGFVSARRGQPARIVYRMASAYLMVGGRVNLTVANASARGGLRLAVSTDGGQRWTEFWRTRKPGVFSAQGDFGRFLSKQRVEPDSPMFRDVYDLQVKLEWEPGGSALAVSNLEIVTDLQMHPQALPALHRGDNRCRFTCKSRRGPVTIVHSWDEMDALYASNSEPVAGETIELYAKVTNRTARNTGPVRVKFYEGHPDLDGRPIGKPVGIRSLAAGKTVTVHTVWKADTRMHRPLRPPYRGYLHTDIFAVIENDKSDAVRPIAQMRLVVKDRLRLELTPAFVQCVPKKPRPGERVRLFAAVWNGSSRKRPYGYGFIYLNGCPLTDVKVRLFAGPPGRGGRLLGERTFAHIEPLEHGLAEMHWTVPAKARNMDIYVEASCMDPTSPKRKRITVRKRIPVAAP